MAKGRVSIPVDVAADVMFASDGTCCKCNERGKAVQIHHINEDPSNNDPVNLAVLCLQCHDETQVSGGFGRHLNAQLVIRYRDNWHARVIQRRVIADKQAVAKLAGPPPPVPEAPPVPVVQPAEAAAADVIAVEEYLEAQLRDREDRAREVREYVQSLPQRRAELQAVAEPDWDSGVTARMVQASYDYIDKLEGILVVLAGFYAHGSFDGDAQRYFAQRVAESFSWHRSHLEPDGPGSGGTIVNVRACSEVIEDVEDMIEDLVMSLVGDDEEFDDDAWQAQW
jgi:hypothetical protein